MTFIFGVLEMAEGYSFLEKKYQNKEVPAFSFKKFT